MKVGEIKEWLTDELNKPYAWQRIVMHLLPTFRDEGYYYHTIDDDVELNENLMNQIDSTVHKFYKTHLPRITF